MTVTVLLSFAGLLAAVAALALVLRENRRQQRAIAEALRTACRAMPADVAADVQAQLAGGHVGERE